MASLRKLLNRYEPLSMQGLGHDIMWGDVHAAEVNGLIDFTSGLLVANIGHDRPEIRLAMGRTRNWTAWYAPTTERLYAYRALASILPGYKFVFLNSGSEAIDCAIKVCVDNVFTPRAQKDCYWGSTVGAGLLRDRYEFAPSLPKAYFRQAFVGYNCRWTTSGEIADMIQQQAKGDIIVFDEMQSGFGRTGKWFGFQHLGIRPDIVVGGKAAAGGVPFAFVAGRPDLMDKNPLADYPSTFSANAFACNALVATIGIIKSERLVARANRIGTIISAMLEGTDCEWQGRGAAWSIVPRDGITTADVYKRCKAKGLLVLDTGRGWIKVAPPLVIDMEDLGRGMKILIDVLREAS